MGPGVKAQCRICKKEALADQFKYHHQYQMLVCPNCFSGRTSSQQEKKVEEAKKPAGWDMEDVYLEKMSHMKKQQNQVSFTKIPGTDLIKLTCQHCKYPFKFDVPNKSPRTCPYCDWEIPRIKL